MSHRVLNVPVALILLAVMPFAAIFFLTADPPTLTLWIIRIGSVILLAVILRALFHDPKIYRVQHKDGLWTRPLTWRQAQRFHRLTGNPIVRIERK